MITCASCKNKTSDDRCPNKVLKGAIFCGKHVGVKDPRLWKDMVSADNKIILIQKVWRGYNVRNWFKLAGPGVLNRKVCHNQEELVTLDEPNSVSPLNYFSFEENGKVYWFDIRSISEHSFGHLNPTNPYTREKLSFEARNRLRLLCIKRHRLGLSNQHDMERKRTVEEVILAGWIHVCQIIEENGFFDMNPLHFVSMNKARLFVFNSLIFQDLRALLAEHKSPNSRRIKYVSWMKRLIREYATGIDHSRFLYLTSKVIVSILNDCREPYPICFVVVSALARL